MSDLSDCTSSRTPSPSPSSSSEPDQTDRLPIPDVTIANFPASATFSALAASLSTPAAREAALKTGGKTIFCFKLTNAAGEQASWYLDLKTTGTVGKGEAPEGEKPDVTLLFKDEDFQKLVEGKVQAQRLFMGGRMKIRGDMMRATKAEVCRQIVHRGRYEYRLIE